MLPWNRPGASGEPTSAMTSMVMSVEVTPPSVACSGVVHWFGAVVDVAAAAPVVGGALVDADVVGGVLREQAPAVRDATASRTTQPDLFTFPPGVKMVGHHTLGVPSGGGRAGFRPRSA